MKSFKLFKVLILFFILGFTSYAQLTSIKVTADQSLRQAIEFCAAQNVDSIILSTSGGIYTEVDTFLYQISEPLIIVADPTLEEKPIITNGYMGSDKSIIEIFRVSDDFTLKGVILDGGLTYSHGMKYGIRVGPDAVTTAPAKTGLDVTVEDVDFRNFYENGTGQGHAFYFLKDVVAGTIRIENCTVNGTGYEAIRMSETEKYAVTKCLDSLIVRNVTFENVAGECLRFYSDLDTSTADAYLLFENLTLNKCNTRMAFIKNNKNSIMRNVIITNDFDGSLITGQVRTDYIMDVQSTGSVVSHIDTFNVLAVPVKSTKGGYVDTLTIYGFDPMYEDAESGNFTLLSGSPAYFAGFNGSHLGDLRWALNEPVSVEEEAQVVNNYKLSQNYPNPFNPVTTISFSIPKESRVTIDVYNVIGQKLDVIVNSDFSAGSHKVVYDASRLHSGVYFYTINAGSYTSTRKMVLLK